MMNLIAERPKVKYSPKGCSSEVFDKILKSLNKEEFISIFFLLQDYLHNKDFLVLTSCDEPSLREELKEMYANNFFDEPFLIEIFGTIKRYDILKQLGSCQHVFKHKKQDFMKIKKIWKVLYEICENLSERDLIPLKQKNVKNLHWNVVDSAEKLFFLALKDELIKENNLSALEKQLQHKTECLKLIQCYNDEIAYYQIKQPTENFLCGIAIILNHEVFWKENENLPFLVERRGSQVDVDKLKKLWEYFGFQVRIYSNKTDEDVYEIFKKISAEDHSSYDVFVACYLSHGNKDVVFASNSKAIKIQELVDIIADSTPTLAGKPKCFFIQACQGTNVQRVTSPNPKCFVETSEEFSYCIDAVPLMQQRPHHAISNTVNSPRCLDVLKVIATIPGYASFRSPEYGSWFVSELVDVMLKHGEDLSITDILIKVTDNVTQKRGRIGTQDNYVQTPINISTLRRNLKFKKLQA